MDGAVPKKYNISSLIHTCSIHACLQTWCVHAGKRGVFMLANVVYSCLQTWCIHACKRGVFMLANVVYSCLQTWCIHACKRGVFMLANLVCSCLQTWCIHACKRGVYNTCLQDIASEVYMRYKVLSSYFLVMKSCRTSENHFVTMATSRIPTATCTGQGIIVTVIVYTTGTTRDLGCFLSFSFPSGSRGERREGGWGITPSEDS